MLSDLYALLRLRCALIIPSIILMTVEFLQQELRLPFVEAHVMG
jgi:hypothetical protein